MQLYAIFLILNIHLGHIFAFPPNPLDFSVQANHGLKGYECGNVFFDDLEIEEALLLARASIDVGDRYPHRYQGKLYSESKFKEYFLWPIKKGLLIQSHTIDPKTIFRVVFTRNSNEGINVVAKITTGDYTKCIPRDSSQIELSPSVPGNPNGYLCGHKFFIDEIVNESLLLSQTKKRKDSKYPSPFAGLIYPKNSGYLIWPITRREEIYKSGMSVVGPYYLVLNKEGQLVDAVVRGFSNNFLRCLRSREPPKAPKSDPLSKLFVPPPKSGFICGRSFFDDKVLEEAAELAKRKVTRGKFPQAYFGPPYNQQCLIWPISKDGSLLTRGNIGRYRFILKPDYKVMSVALLVNGELKACDRTTITGKKNHDSSDYDCNGRIFSYQQLLKAAEKACVKMNTATIKVYPARYEGPRFKLEGPYLTYPVFLKGFFGPRNTGQDRVVINSSCEVVGALTDLNKVVNGSPKRLVKCHRLDDGPLPSDFFGTNAETVSEYRTKY